MIAKSTRGGNARGLASYLHGPGHGEAHHYDADAHGRVIGGNLAPVGEADGAQWGRTMDRIIKRRPEVKKPVYQVSFSTAPGDRVLTAGEWRQVANEWLEVQGCATHPHVLVQHDPGHVHLVVSRVGFDQSLWHAQQDYAKNRVAMRNVEQQLGLEKLPTKERPAPRAAKTGTPSRAEQQLEKRGVVPWKEQLRQRIDAALGGNPATAAEFTQALARRQITVKNSKSGELLYTVATTQGPRTVSGPRLGAGYARERLPARLLPSLPVAKLAKVRMPRR